jgi:hypothetical protein
MWFNVIKQRGEGGGNCDAGIAGIGNCNNYGDKCQGIARGKIIISDAGDGGWIKLRRSTHGPVPFLDQNNNNGSY